MTPNVGTRLYVFTEAHSQLSAAALEEMDGRIAVGREIDSGALKNVLSVHDLFVQYVRPGPLGFGTHRTAPLRPYFASIEPKAGDRTFVLEPAGCFTIVKDDATPGGAAGNAGIRAALNALGTRSGAYA